MSHKFIAGRNSRYVPIKVIPNGLDVQKYKPIDRQLAKNLLRLPPDKQIVLFGAVCSTSEHEQNGYLAQPYEVEDLAKEITWVLEDRERWRKLCDRARQKAEREFTIDLQAQWYITLYKELI